MPRFYRFNAHCLKEKRQELRNNAPRAELLLWRQLKGSKLNGLKFRRQYGVGAFTVDFYCASVRLAIELDGDSHFEEGAQKYDAMRQAFIEKFGIHFLRFTNQEIRWNLKEVLERISIRASELSLAERVVAG